MSILAYFKSYLKKDFMKNLSKLKFNGDFFSESHLAPNSFQIYCI